jgi:hypothetical protein
MPWSESNDTKLCRNSRGVHARTSRCGAPAALRGRAVAPRDVARFNGWSLSSGGLAQVYGFTDLDGNRPDSLRYLVEVQDAGKPAGTTGYW